MQRYCACYTKRLLTHHETCWNVTKCHAKHAKLHCDLLRHHGKGKVLQLPPIDTATASTEFVRHPRNLYFVTTSRSPANAIRLKCCACHAQATWTQPKYCACHTKRLSTRYETCCNVTKWHACHERRGYTRRLKPPNVRIFAKLVIRVAIAASLPTAAGISTRPPK